MIWTTTPWTLPTNVAAAVKPIRYGLRANGEWVAVARYPSEAFVRTVAVRARSGSNTRVLDDLPALAEVVHRVIPWEEVSLGKAPASCTSPGAGGPRTSSCRRCTACVLAPIDEAGRFYAEYGEFEGRSTEEVETPVIVELDRRGRIVEHGSIVHRCPVCWRCATRSSSESRTTG